MQRNIVDYIRSLLPRTRKSNPFSKLLRPLFEKGRFKYYLGIQLAGAAAVLGVVTYPAQAFDYSISQGSYVDGTPSEVVTETTFQFPLTSSYDLSQGYYRLHPGVDLRARLQTPVYPVASGRVIEAAYLRYGYGHYVLLEHAAGYQSLYAHLGEIFVEVGQEISRDQVIAEVGLTGFTTGAHLHLEMYRYGSSFNPMSVLPTPSAYEDK